MKSSLKLFGTINLFSVLFFVVLFLLSSCSTSRSVYGNSKSGHGWGQESKCGKQKKSKWQRTAWERDRNGNVKRVSRPQCIDNW